MEEILTALDALADTVRAFLRARVLARYDVVGFERVRGIPDLVLKRNACGNSPCSAFASLTSVSARRT